MAWHRDSGSGSGLLLLFQVFLKKWKNGLAGHRGVGWAVGLPCWFLCNLPGFRKIKGDFGVDSMFPFGLSSHRLEDGSLKAKLGQVS